MVFEQGWVAEQGLVWQEEIDVTISQQEEDEPATITPVPSSARRANSQLILVRGGVGGVEVGGGVLLVMDFLYLFRLLGPHEGR